MIKQRYKKDIQSKVAPEIVQSSILKAITDNKLKTVGSPVIEKLGEIDAEKDYVYEAIVETYPEIGEINIKDFKLEKTLYKYTEKEVEAQLKAIQNSLATKEELIDGSKAEKNNLIKIDYESFLDDKPVNLFENASNKNQILKIGESAFPEDFEKELIGATKGEKKEFKIILSKDFVQKKLAEKEVFFKVNIKEIREEKIPAIDDEMAKKAGKEFKTLEDLKNQIKKNLQDGYDKRSEQETSEQIFQKLIEQVDFEVPEALIRYELDLIVQEAKRMFQSYNISLEQVGQSEDQIREKYKNDAEAKAKRHIVLDAVVKQENIEVSENDFENNYKKVSKQYNFPIEKVKEMYEKKIEQKEALKSVILEEKAMKLILGNSEIKEVEPKIEESKEK